MTWWVGGIAIWLTIVLLVSPPEGRDTVSVAATFGLNLLLWAFFLLVARRVGQGRWIPGALWCVGLHAGLGTAFMIAAALMDIPSRTKVPMVAAWAGLLLVALWTLRRLGQALHA